MTPDKKEWSEFKWESEIRKDEERINKYLTELKECIDLPDEEEMILKRMQRIPGLVPQNLEFGSASFPDVFDDFDIDDDLLQDENWRKKNDAEIYVTLEQLAYQWNVFCASELTTSTTMEGMHITCIYGKLMARTADLLDTTTSEYPNLKIALCKRIAGDLNTLIGLLNDVSQQQTSFAPKMDTYITHLHNIREKIIRILEKNRKKN